jgi:hypothetical protein
MVNAPINNNQPIKHSLSIRSFTPSNVVMPAQKPNQTVQPKIAEVYKNGFTPTSIKLPAPQPKGDDND